MSGPVTSGRSGSSSRAGIGASAYLSVANDGKTSLVDTSSSDNRTSPSVSDCGVSPQVATFMGSDQLASDPRSVALESSARGVHLAREIAADIQASPSSSLNYCLLYTSPSPRDLSTSRMPSSA